MASIRKRGNKWQARVSRTGFPVETKSFSVRTDAERWARSIETEMDRGSFVSRSEAEANTLEDIIERYISDVMPTRKGASDEIPRLRATCRTRLAKLSMAALTPKAVAAYRDERLKQVKPATVIRELAYLSAIINHARREWDINITNPVTLVRKPPSPQGRDRVLSAEEEARLLAALVPTGRINVWLLPATVLSLETGMRRGELVELRWSNVNLEAQTAYLPMTKNGMARTVPLSKKAVATLAAFHYTQVCCSSSRAYLIPAAKSTTRCMPSQMVLTPGSPSPLRARKPLSLATSRTTSFSRGDLSGGAFLLRMKAAFHSSGSNSSPASRSGQVRPSRMRRAMRHATTMNTASARSMRSIVLSCSASTRQPFFST